MTPARLAALVVEFERLWRERTPAKQVRHVLAGQRVNWTDLQDWYWKTYTAHLRPIYRRVFASAVKPVLARLRREFPNERWD